MKIFRKTAALLLAVLLAVAAVPSVFASGSSVTTNPGKTVEVTFSYSQVYGVDGTFTLDDPDGVVESWSVKGYSGSGITGSVTNGACFLYSMDNAAHNIKITFKVVIKSGSSLTGTAKLLFNYSLTTDAMGNTTDYATDVATITVKKASQTQVTEPGENPGTTTKVDYSDLERQIAIANGLNSGDYTRDSWDVLTAALAQANAALSSKKQDEVDTATTALSEAIAALVQVDYSGLRDALDTVESWLDSEDSSDLWIALADAVNRADALLYSGDQAAVDAMTQELLNLLAQIKAQLEEQKTPEIVIKEVEVEVPPSGEYCNISMHQLWLVLLIVSLVLNVVFGVIIIVYVNKKRRNRKDDTPLVDYDIDDDI